MELTFQLELAYCGVVVRLRQGFAGLRVETTSSEVQKMFRRCRHRLREDSQSARLLTFGLALGPIQRAGHICLEEITFKVNPSGCTT